MGADPQGRQDQSCIAVGAGTCYNAILSFKEKQMSKLDIANEMKAFDTKDRNFYDSLDEAERKKFSTFLMLKWGCNVEGSAELQEWYLRVHNERVNLNFFDLGRHPKLQWLLCTTVSPLMGSKRHYWLKLPKKADNSAYKFIEVQFPELKADEIELMVELNTIAQLKDMARDLGWDEKKIKAEL